MNANDKEELVKAMIELIESNDEIRWAVQSCARCSPNIVKPPRRSGLPNAT